MTGPPLRVNVDYPMLELWINIKQCMLDDQSIGRQASEIAECLLADLATLSRQPFAVPLQQDFEPPPHPRH